MPIEHILVSLDGSSASHFALPVAASLARATGAKLHLTHVFLPIPLPLEGRRTLPTRDEATAYVEEIAAKVTASARVPVLADVVEGSFAAPALLERVHALHADLLVMSTHGRGGVSRLWIGSVADAVTRQAECPILLVRSHEGAPPQLDVDAVFRHILVPLDGSHPAEAALEPAVALGRPGQARFTLLRVEPSPSPLPLIEDPGSLANAVREQASEHARAYLVEVVQRLRAQGITADAELSRAPHVAGAITQAAEARGADLIAISSRGLGGARRMLMGSVADKVVRSANVPVLVVHPHPRGSA